jgi:hypothetical protein
LGNDPILPAISKKVAGIDIGSTSHYVAIPPDGYSCSVREFPSHTVGITVMANWLKANQIDAVAMEATGIYWQPTYNYLEKEGFEVCLVNPLVKGIYLILLNKKIPFAHDIESIVIKFKDKLSEPVNEERLLSFSKLSAFYIDDRYPAFDGEKVAYDKIDALNILFHTKETFEWLLRSSPIPTSTPSEQLKSSPKP